MPLDTEAVHDRTLQRHEAVGARTRFFWVSGGYDTFGQAGAMPGPGDKFIDGGDTNRWKFKHRATTADDPHYATDVDHTFWIFSGGRGEGQHVRDPDEE